MLVLEFDWHSHRGPQREAECRVEVLGCNGVDVCDEDIEHDHLITKSLFFFNNDSHFSILVEGLDAFIID